MITCAPTDEGCKCRMAIEFVKNELKKTWEPQQKAYSKENSLYMKEMSAHSSWETSRDIQKEVLNEKKYAEWLNSHPEPSMRPEPTYPSFPSFTIPPEYQTTSSDCCVQQLVGGSTKSSSRDLGNIAQSCLDMGTNVVVKTSSPSTSSSTSSSSVYTQSVTSPPSGSSSSSIFVTIVWTLLIIIGVLLIVFGLYRAFRWYRMKQIWEQQLQSGN